MLVPALKEGIEPFSQDGLGKSDEVMAFSDMHANFIKSVRDIKISIFKTDNIGNSPIQQSKSEKVLPILESIKAIMLKNTREDPNIDSKRYYCLVVSIESSRCLEN
jgi:hypothetical protein